MKRAQKKIWNKGNDCEKRLNPAHPGYVEYSTLLDYLEKYATCAALYLHEFGHSYSNREQIHEMWVLRKKVRDADEWKIESKWDEWYKKHVADKFGKETKNVHKSRPTKDKMYQIAFQWEDFDPVAVEEYYNENKDAIVEYYKDKIEDLWHFYFETEDRFEDVKKAIAEKDAPDISKDEARKMVVRDVILPHDIIEHYAKDYYHRHVVGTNKEINERFADLGAYIFGSVYRHRDETTEIGYDHRDEKEYKQKLKEYMKKSDAEKLEEYPPMKHPALLMWWD